MSRNVGRRSLLRAALVLAIIGSLSMGAAGSATALVPKAHESKQYDQFARRMFNAAAARSNKVHAVGVSVGGAHAVAVGLREKNRLAPDGTIVARKLIKSSGAKNWDDAVLRAIDKTEILPRDTDGRVPPIIEIDFKPRD